MKKLTGLLTKTMLGAAMALGGCGLFDDGGGDPCEGANCAGNDRILVFYQSKADSSANVFDWGFFAPADLSFSTILHDNSGTGPAPFFEKNAATGATQFSVEAHPNLRGLALRLGTLPPDTLLLTTGLRPADGCCPEAVTFSQLLANGLPVATVGSATEVFFYK